MLIFIRLLNGICFAQTLYFADLIVSIKFIFNVLSNYRPICITCVPCKLLKRIVINEIYKHLVDNDILCNDQHGFVRGRSTWTNLLEALNDWTHNI